MSDADAEVVTVRDLRKDYGDTVAVDGLSFSIPAGEVFALLGPNGAGKTTTVEILEGHRDRTSGEVSVLGFDPATAARGFRERIGIVLQEAGFDEEFSVRELVSMYAGLYPRRRDTEEVIDAVGLADKADVRTKALSGGQRRRLDLALGIIGDPELLFLDEPTTGFDPSARRKAWGLIGSLRDLGTTIVLTTHYMEEAEVLADRVAVIDAGRLIALDTPEFLVRRAARAVLKFELTDGADAAEVPDVGRHRRVVGSTVRIESSQPTEDLRILTDWACARGAELDGLELARPSLEDVYLDLTGDAAARRQEAGGGDVGSDGEGDGGG